MAAFHRMGDKATARRCMEEAGVPVIPGSREEVGSLEEARLLAGEIGFPLRLKASAGGGGRGMRGRPRRGGAPGGVADGPPRSARRLHQRRALHGSVRSTNARHIEIQVLGDHHGTVVHLGERECSIQRRHQKLLEESPSPAVDEELRKRLGDAAVRGAASVGYASAGTVEFLVDGDGEFYFLEMNKRIQVEHPVTEMVSGVDLIGEMIRVAGGERLGYGQEDLALTGHAIECRINAEDPDRNFMPSAGTITALHLPGGPGLRIDSHIYQGYEVPPY